MPQSFVQGSVINIGLLAIACLIILIIGYRLKLRPSNPNYQLFLGLTFGLIAAAVIRFPLVVEDGAVFDTRAAPTVLAGFFGGPIAGVVCGIIAVLMRAFVGGPVDYVVSAAIGMAVFVAIGVVAGNIFRRYTNAAPGALTFLLLAAATVLIWFPTLFVTLPLEQLLNLLNEVLLFFVLGNFIGIVVLGLAYQTIRDLIDQKAALEKALTVSNMAREAAGIGVWRLQFEPERLDWDERLLELHDIAPEEFRGAVQEWRDATHPDDLRQATKAFMTAKTNQEVFSWRFRVGGQKTGNWRWGRVHGRFTTDPELGDPIALGLTWDVTAEEEAKQDRDRALQESVELNNRLNAFARTASHDLQEPLRKMTILADFAKHSIEQGDEETALDNLLKIQSVSRNARVLVKDLLDFSRAPQSGIRREPISIREAIDEAVEYLSEAAKEGGVEIERPDQDVVIVADRPKFVRLLTNFLSNAIKYRSSERQSRIWITIESDKPDGSLDLHFCDNGIGFDEEQKAKLFQPFMRLHNMIGAKGSGIGLSVCKLFCDLHGWSLDAFSSPGQPTRFVIAIPAKDIVSVPQTDGRCRRASTSR